MASHTYICVCTSLMHTTKCIHMHITHTHMHNTYRYTIRQTDRQTDRQWIVPTVLKVDVGISNTVKVLHRHTSTQVLTVTITYIYTYMYTYVHRETLTQKTCVFYAEKNFHTQFSDKTAFLIRS